MLQTTFDQCGNSIFAEAVGGDPLSMYFRQNRSSWAEGILRVGEAQDGEESKSQCKTKLRWTRSLKAQRNINQHPQKRACLWEGGEFCCYGFHPEDPPKGSRVEGSVPNAAVFRGGASEK